MKNGLHIFNLLYREWFDSVNTTKLPSLFWRYVLAQRKTFWWPPFSFTMADISTIFLRSLNVDEQNIVFRFQIKTKALKSILSKLFKVGWFKMQ